MAKSMPFREIPVGSLMRQGTTIYKKTDPDYYCRIAKGKESHHETKADFDDMFILVTNEWVVAREKQKKNQAIAQKERDDCMRSLGLTKVKGSVSGKIYWE